MEISELTLKLIIILIPGAIASRIYQKVSIHEKWSAFKFIANAILFGGLSYLLAEWVIRMFSEKDTFIQFWNNLPTKEIPFNDVLYACIASVVVGFVVSAIDHYKGLNHIARFLRISRKYGDENLFSYFLNSPM